MMTAPESKSSTPFFLTVWDALALSDEVADTTAGLLEMGVGEAELAENLRVIRGEGAERATRIVLLAMKSEKGRAALRAVLAAR